MCLSSLNLLAIWIEAPVDVNYNHVYNNFCTPSLFRLDRFAIALGLLGTVITFVDIIRIILDGPELIDDYWNVKVHKTKEGTIKSSYERDLKLATSVMSLEYYVLLACGGYSDYPLFLMPYLAMQICVIMFEAFIFLFRILFERVRIRRREILISALMIHNWLYIFCLFRQQIGKCDL